MIILVPETGPQEAPQVIKKRGTSWWVVVYAGRDPAWPATGPGRVTAGSSRQSGQRRAQRIVTGPG
jgi:hypothetical protein